MLEEYLNVTRDTHRAHEHFLNSICYSLGPYELKDLIKNDLESFTLTDVRKYEDYINGHIPYATHIPYHSLDENMNKFSKDKVNIIYCYSVLCHIAKECAVRMTAKGYPTMILTGGYKGWKKQDFDIIKESAGQG